MTDFPKIRAITTCVDYSDLLSITLAANMRFFHECQVNTTPDDTATHALCNSVPNVSMYQTDEFYRDGAHFNKGRAMESGFDVFGRDGWILIWDADIMLPDNFLESLPHPLIPHCLYGASRRIVDDPLRWDPEVTWKIHPLRNDNRRPIGFFQLFHASSAHLQRRPWYDQSFTHAGGGDGYFESLTPKSHQVILPIDVLHLGPSDSNWFGRSTKRLDGTIPERSQELSDLIRSLHRSKGWAGFAAQGQFNEHISNPEIVQTGHVCQ